MFHVFLSQIINRSKHLHVYMQKRKMQKYSDFMSAYEADQTGKEVRMSKDIPTDFTQWKEIITNTPVVVIYMWSEHCHPCTLISDKFERLVASMQNEHILFVKDNIDLPTSFHRNHIEVVPTFYILCDGKELRNPHYPSVFNGWMKDDMERSINYHLNQSTIYQQRQQQQQQRKLYCRNNVCYIVPPDDND